MNDISITIDLSGPNGNAFYILGTARRLADRLNFDENKTQDILKEMQSGDYENLLATFEEHFGDYVTIYR